jgi:hypothetical protein
MVLTCSNATKVKNRQGRENAAKLAKESKGVRRRRKEEEKRREEEHLDDVKEKKIVGMWEERERGRERHILILGRQEQESTWGPTGAAA